MYLNMFQVILIYLNNNYNYFVFLFNFFLFQIISKPMIAIKLNSFRVIGSYCEVDIPGHIQYHVFQFKMTAKNM